MKEFRQLKGRDHSVQIIKNIAYKWETVAYGFHFEPSEVDSITRDYKDVEAACEKMLSKWVLGEHRTPVAWSTVVECLRECEFQTLADNLEHILHLEEVCAICREYYTYCLYNYVALPCNCNECMVRFVQCVGSNSETDTGKHKTHAQSKGVVEYLLL